MAVRDHMRGTDHQIDDYRHFVATFPDLDWPALAVRAPSFPQARLSWGDVLCLIPRLERYYPAGKLDKIVRCLATIRVALAHIPCSVLTCHTPAGTTFRYGATRRL